MDKKSLSLMPVGEIIDELFSRFDHAVFMGASQRDKNQGIVYHDRKGNEYVVAGMCQHAANKALAHVDESQEGGE